MFTYLTPTLQTAVFGHHRNRIIVIKGEVASNQAQVTAVPGTKIVLIGDVELALWQQVTELTRHQLQEKLPISAEAHYLLKCYLANNVPAITAVTHELTNELALHRLDTSPRVLIVHDGTGWTHWLQAEPSNTLLVGWHTADCLAQYIHEHGPQFAEQAGLSSGGAYTSLRLALGLQLPKGRPKKFLENGAPIG